MSPSNKKHRRWFLWVPLLALCLYLAFKPSDESLHSVGAVVQPALKSSAQPRDQAKEKKVESKQDTVFSLRRRETLYPESTGQHTGKDLFAAIDWSPPPPPAATPAPPAPPMAPALPFAFLGKRRAAQGWEVFLGKGDDTFLVRDGQTFADSYRVESIQPPQMILTYMPLNQIQTISVGEIR